MPLLVFWPPGCSLACDHGCMMQGSTSHDLLLAPKLDDRHVLGWVDFICSFDITPIALADKLLVHLVLPRCELGSIELFCRKSASHLSVHVELPLLLFDTNCAGCCYNDQPVLREHEIRHNTRDDDGLGSSYRAQDMNGHDKDNQ